MSANDLMTPSMLAKELNAGSVTVKFWLKRFGKWLPHTDVNGEKLYHADTLKTLLSISEKIDSGMVATDVEQVLDAENSPINSDDQSLNSFIPSLQSIIQDVPELVSSNQPLALNESIKLISALFEKFYSQQERIAAAEERKAAAEEKKAVAEEQKAEAELQKAEALARRAEAELQKANAMNNLADALKSISTGFMSALANGSVFPPGDDIPANSQDQKAVEPTSVGGGDQRVPGDEQVYDQETLNSEIDDLSKLIEIDTTTAENIQIDSSDIESDEKMDDLSALVDEVTAPSDFSDNTLNSEMDDLSKLIEIGTTTAENIQIDSSDIESDETMDDLSALVDEDEHHHYEIQEILDSDLDNLAALIDDDTQLQEASVDNLLDNDSFNSSAMNDLSVLIDEEPTYLNPNILDSDVDDLMSLIPDNNKYMPPRKSERRTVTSILDNDIMDDSPNIDALSAIDDQSDTGTLPKIERPKASLEQNFEQYKSEVINIIIQLRKQGHSVEQTTDILNEEEIKPLSGKNRWTTKMIAKIYTFIEAVQK